MVRERLAAAVCHAAKALAQSRKLNCWPVVREIEMRTELGDEGIAALAPAIAGQVCQNAAHERFTKLKHLRWQVVRGCRSLDIHQASVSDTGAAALSEALVATTSSWFETSSYRLSLSLAGNPIGNVGVAALAKLIPYLHELDLSVR